MTTINQSQLLNEYKNPLDAYRSYSYQFLLTLSSTTQSLREMIGNYKGGRGGPVTSASPLLAASKTVKRPGDAFTVNGQTAYLLVDTRRFSQYSITKLDMEHVYGSGSSNNPTVPVSATHMQLIDTTGMSFFNLLMETFRNKLQTTRSSAFFLLTIIFTGHKDDGTTETISTCFIPMMLLTMGFKLDHRGTTFEIDFMETESAPQRGGAMEIMNSLGKVTSISSKGSSSTVGGLVSALERRLNVQSMTFFKKYTNSALQTNANAKAGKLVQYMITVPSTWEKFPITTAARSKNKEQIFLAAEQAGATRDAAAAAFDSVKLKDEGEYTQMSFSQTVTITDAIKSILESSTEFLALASEDKVKAGTAQTFKTSVNVTCDDNSYVVHFDVFPYYLPKVNTDKGNETANTSAVSAGGKTVIGPSTEIRNLMTYNYIFTGKNSHIKDLTIEYLPESAVALDTNLDLGQSRFKTVSGQGQKAVSVDKASESAVKKTTSFVPDLRGSDPIFFAIQSQDQQNNVAAQKNERMTSDEARDAFKKKQEYTNTMAYVHFISSIELDMTIRGNPNIIKKFADRNERGGVGPHSSIIDATGISRINAATGEPDDIYNSVLAQKISTAKSLYYSEYVQPRIAGVTKAGPPGSDQFMTGPDVSVSPVFCKINILAPNVDSMGDYLRDLSDPNRPDKPPYFTDEFFFNGPYMVLFVKTTFEDGDFQHTLSMIPYIASETVTKKDEPTKSTATKTK